MHYELSCQPISNHNLPIKLQGQEYQSLQDCPDWVDGVIARTAHAYVCDAAKRNTSPRVAGKRLLGITGQEEAFACYLALTLIEAGDEQELIDYVIFALEDSNLRQKVNFAHSSILERYALSGYHSYARKPPQIQNQIDELWPLRKASIRSFRELAIAFDDELMAKRLVAQASNRFDYTLSFLSELAQRPYRESRVRTFLVGCFDDVLGYEIKRRLAIQHVMMDSGMTLHNYSKIPLDEAPPYGAYDFRDAALIDLRVFETPGFDQWLQQHPSSYDTLAASLNYSPKKSTKAQAKELFAFVDQVLTRLFESTMTVHQVYMQACMGYDRERYGLLKNFHTSEKDLHHEMMGGLISHLADDDILCNHIGKRFVSQLGLPYVLSMIERQDDFLVIAKHFKQSLVLQRLTNEQRDGLMGHDLGL